MKNLNAGMGLIQVMLILVAVNGAIYITSEYLKQDTKAQKNLTNRAIISGLSDELSMIIATSALCKISMIGLDNKPISTINYTDWKNNVPVQLEQINLSDIAFAKRLAQIQGVILSSISVARYQDTKLGQARNDAIDRVGSGNTFAYPSLLTVTFKDLNQIVLPSINLKLNLYADSSGRFTGCSEAYHSMVSAMATRSAYSIYNKGCQVFDGTKWKNRSPIPATSPLINANVCPDNYKNIDNAINVGDGVCDLPVAGQQLAVSAHPRKSSTSSWINLYDQNGRDNTNNAPIKVEPSIPNNFGTFTYAEEGRCWFTLSANVGNLLPFKLDSLGNLTNKRWTPKEIFIMPNQASQYSASESAMTLGCNEANGWILSGCMRKSYNTDKSGDADVDVAVSGRDSYCYTNNMMRPHEDGAWTSIREDLQVVCVRMNETL